MNNKKCDRLAKTSENENKKVREEKTKRKISREKKVRVRVKLDFAPGDYFANTKMRYASRHQSAGSKCSACFASGINCAHIFFPPNFSRFLFRFNFRYYFIPSNPIN